MLDIKTLVHCQKYNKIKLSQGVDNHERRNVMRSKVDVDTFWVNGTEINHSDEEELLQSDAHMRQDQQPFPVSYERA